MNILIKLTLSFYLILSAFSFADTNVNFDTDNNGLYDDQERKALLDYLQVKYPELIANYDLDGDGAVSILEQTEGRLPLSMRIAKDDVAENEEKVTWALNLFPEWIMTAYFQDDVDIGKVSTHDARGNSIRNATQSTSSLAPEKFSNNNGIEFKENSGQFLTMSGQREARWAYRWTIFTFRIDADSGDDDTTVMVDINRGNASNKSSPKIWYNKSTGLNIQFVGRNENGLDKRIMTTKTAVVADGETWNVVVTGIRYGQMFASVNGVNLSTESPQPERYANAEIGNDTSSYIGDDSDGNMAWAYDTLAFGLTEPTEAMVRKMTGWAAYRLDSSDNGIILPNDHVYKTSNPVMDQEDFPYRYVHDNDQWSEWGTSINSTDVKVNGGGSPVEVEGFERVFYDDFRNDRVKASYSGESDLWSAPGFNTAVGSSATLIAPSDTTNVYEYDESEQKQSLSLLKVNDRWKAAAFYSVNDLGYGYTWKGPKIFRIRSMFPEVAQADLAGGLFPAFWSYDPDFLFWRTANRIEVDWFEFDGKNGAWLNGLASHYHYAAVDNIFAKNAESYTSYKAYSGQLTEAKSKIEGGMKFWDGEYHTWEFVIDDDMTYINVTIKDSDGNDKWVEVGRVETPPTYLERLDLQLDYALNSWDGEPSSDREDFTIDSIEVLQKTSNIMELPDIFTSRPTITGEQTEGSTITCQANVEGITDIRYYWFANAYPLTYTASNEYEITSDDVGKSIRCMVKAVGALDMPEAWTESIRVPADNTPVAPSELKLQKST
ncbi:hypothetical protein OW492_16340 [Psychromonas sp. 14N.309.X.WAT.B.A12]|uniref:hypothetical protein n=1 Tax=Psychromonas sp. 14N.309.X.WAT.B.A12 TaxID=2998322 RepID=UPI0025AF9C01|nr:hypothetical protein [Psychromonas sp. 14N.309.X.WAT.B.A12]MDN2664946.1 hypothetical protein [Psychromonas sp. 14N.309.X.WAT.B.A12]